MPKFTTNTEFINNLMEFGCPTGALIQPFVIQALESYSKQVIEAGPEKMETSFLSGEAWVATAKHVLKSVEDRYKHHDHSPED